MTYSLKKTDNCNIKSQNLNLMGNLCLKGGPDPSRGWASAPITTPPSTHTHIHTHTHTHSFGPDRIICCDVDSLGLIIEIIGNFRLDYEYDIEYDFEISEVSRALVLHAGFKKRGWLMG